MGILSDMTWGRRNPGGHGSGCVIVLAMMLAGVATSVWSTVEVLL